ncbi:hypothetical protein HYH02_014871 [Chlamydomonas schloesseri]|uniref:Uncharacterized protein n=1 Tax=Chlamydomonas schloesseri TaxID=2026947 RepID=A0A835VUZ5_9CHLO|nr:hypothetical protein HYH02_014871 [Chlamydomonas schloesseri]|eukprot:KAG2426116.1 hypothetical protein HYH02_014871 [Chlamydomonas schloesseri]
MSAVVSSAQAGLDPAADGFAVLYRVLWMLGVATTTPASEKGHPYSMFGRGLHGHRAFHSPADLPTLAESVANGSCRSALCLSALRRTVTSPWPSRVKVSGTEGYKTLKAAWAIANDPAAVSASTAPVSGHGTGGGGGRGDAGRLGSSGSGACWAGTDDGQPWHAEPPITSAPPLAVAKGWEDGTLLVHVDTRPFEKMHWDLFTLEDFPWPAYPPWNDSHAGRAFLTVFDNTNYSLGFNPEGGRFVYTRDPNATFGKHYLEIGAATINRMVADGLGITYRRIKWWPPAERWHTWTKTDFFIQMMTYVVEERCGASSTRSPLLTDEQRAVLRTLIPPGGLKQLIVLDGDAYIRDPVRLRQSLAAFASNSSAFMAFGEEPNTRGAYWLDGAPQYYNTGWQVVKPCPKVLEFYRAVWDCPYNIGAWWKGDMLMKWPHEQGCHNYISFQEGGMLTTQTQVWPMRDYNTPAGRVVRHAWGSCKEKWWRIIAEDMVGIAIWHYYHMIATSHIHLNVNTTNLH